MQHPMARATKKTTHLLRSLLLLKHFLFLSYNFGLILEAESKW